MDRELAMVPVKKTGILRSGTFAGSDKRTGVGRASNAPTPSIQTPLPGSGWCLPVGHLKQPCHPFLRQFRVHRTETLSHF